jgi:hypothetical protein
MQSKTVTAALLEVAGDCVSITSPAATHPFPTTAAILTALQQAVSDVTAL